MPRRKNQGGNVNSVDADSAQNVARNQSAELPSRDTTLRELQSMFAGSVDPEVVQLVLSESNYNANDAIEKLFVLGGTEQDLNEEKCASEKKTDHELRPLSKTFGAHGETHAQKTVPSSRLPLSPVPCERNQAQTHPESFPDTASSTTLSSGLPDFPDSISQQYKALKSQEKVSLNFDSIPHEKPSAHSTNTRPPLIQQVICSSESLGINNAGEESKPTGTSEPFLKQNMSQRATTDKCKSTSPDNAEQQRLDWEPSKKKMYSGDFLTHTDMFQDKRQKPSKERTSNICHPQNVQSMPSAKTQSVGSSNNSFNSPKTLPSYGSNKPHFRPASNSTQQLPSHGTFNSLPVTKESMFHPPAIQRQVPPFVTPLGFGQAIQSNTSQVPRFGLMPVTSSQWQQGPQRTLVRGQVLLQYPQGNHPAYQPPFFLGRGGQLSAVARSPKQASGVQMPFSPVIHQRLLILIRGLPGSGKSTLALKLKGAHGVVLSTDDFFYRNQRYEFDAMLLSEAHEWNQKRAKSAIEKLTSPVIIDNTNTQAWEMKPYVSMALKHAYYVKFIEPDTSWKWNVKELARRNRHGVTIETITRMKERFEQGLTVEKIINCEGKPDPNRTENNYKTLKETGAKKQNLIPRAPPTLQKEGSLGLGKSDRNTFDYTTSAENTALTKVVHSSSVDRENEKNNALEGNEIDFLGVRESSKKRVENLNNSENSSEDEEDISASKNPPYGHSKDVPDASISPKPQRVPRTRERRSPNVEQLNDTDNTAKSDIRVREYSDDFTGEETEAINSPRPQRVPRVRERRSPNVEQRSDTDNVVKSDVCTRENSDDVGGEEMQAFDSPLPQRPPRVRERISPSDHDLVTIRAPEDLSCRGSDDKLQLNSIANAVSDPEKGSASLELSKDSLSATDRHIFLPPFFKGDNEDDSEEVALASENPKSSMPFVDFAFPSDSSPELHSAFLSNASSWNSGKSNRVTDKRLGEDFEVKASSGEQTTCNLPPSDKSTSLARMCYVDKDAMEGANIGLKHREPTEKKSVAFPPPLSTILASASKSKQKKLSASSTSQKQSVEDAENYSEETDVKQLKEPTVYGPERVCSDNVTQENRYKPTKDMLSDVHNLRHEAEDASSGYSANDFSTGVEFLKTCFPDIESDVISALLTDTSGDVMKVVNELLADESDLVSFPVGETDLSTQQSQDSQILASQNRPFKSLNGSLKSVKPIDESYVAGDHTHEVRSQSSALRQVSDIPREISAQVDQTNQPRSLESSPLAKAQASSRSTFQLTLEPAIALHLVELFGPFTGVNFQEDLSLEDLIIDVDNTLAKQLYKRWEKSIQKRKGIPVDKKVTSPRANKKPADSSSRFLNEIQSSSDSHRPPQQLRTELQSGNLREIMDEQLALELSRNANVADVNGQDIAINLKRRKLFEMFPGVDPTALEEVFQANQFELGPSVEVVKASCNLSGEGIPNTVIAPGLRNKEKAKRKEPEEDWSWLYQDDSSRSETESGPFQTLEAPSYRDYRAEAFQHYKQRDECFKKAALAFSKKQGQLAQVYAQQGHMHTEKMKEANARAAALILEQTNKYSDENTIDLHGLHVTEAVEALENMMSERKEKGCKAISVITGRGNNSRGGKARIKPAILEYLKKNNYNYTEPHPGLVKVIL